jgi:hypothetical protein
MAVQIEIKGLNEIISNFERYDEIGRFWLDRAIKTALFQAEAKVIPLTPIDSGNLRNWRTWQVEPLGGKIQFLAPYAVYVHEGTARWPLSMPPRNPGTVRQFVKEGEERARPDIIQTFNDALDRVAEELGKQ